MQQALSKPTHASVSVGALLVSTFKKASHSARAGLLAGAMQVFAFMWLRTAMNYQYKFGGSLKEVLSKLYKEGGIARFYRGLLPWGLCIAPLARFGDVMANDFCLGVSRLLIPGLPVGVVTFAGSTAGSAWRALITPIGTCKTILQTDGNKGWDILKDKIQQRGLLVLWSGWEGDYLANIVSNYPFWATMNFLQKVMPQATTSFTKLLRNALIGAISSSVSDVISNSIRVVTTKKSTHENANITYAAAAKETLDQDGMSGLFLRGLDTRILTNVMQSAFFTVLWKYFSGQS